jgi:hypothetical protein
MALKMVTGVFCSLAYMVHTVCRLLEQRNVKRIEQAEIARQPAARVFLVVVSFAYISSAHTMSRFNNNYLKDSS